MEAKEVFEITLPRDSEETPESASALFASLSNYSSSLLQRLFGRNRCLTFEIALINQRVHFLSVVSKNFSSYFISQVAAQYPKAIVTKQKDFLQNLDFTKADFGQLVFTNYYYLPIKTFKEFKEVDPLSSFLGLLSKAAPSNFALYQLSISPASAAFYSGARKFLDKGIPQPDGKSTKSHPQANLIENKIGKKAFRASLRLLAVCESKEASASFLSNMTGSFGAFTLGDGNGFYLKRPKFWQRNKFLKAIQNRSFYLTPKFQYLNVEELATIFHLPNLKLSTIKNISWGGQKIGEPPPNLPVVANLSEEEKKEINFFAKTEFNNQLVTFGIKKTDRRRHVYIIGKTGTGKTTMIANMAINDIRNGEGVGLIDPHGDLSEIILNYIPSWRINDVCYFDPSDVDHPFRLNPLEVFREKDAELVASGIISIFQKIYHDSWGPRMEYILRNSILTIIVAPNSTLLDIPRLLTDSEFRHKLVDKYASAVLKTFWYKEYDPMPPKLQHEVILPVLYKIGQFVTSPMINAIISHPRSTINLEKIMNEGKILIANFSQGKLGEDNASLLGAMLINKMQLSAMNRIVIPESERRDFYLYVDEFQNFATHSFIKILSEARKFRLNITLSNQYIGQLDIEIQKAILGNVGTLASFLVGATDADVLSKEFGNLYQPKDLVSLGNYQIILKLAIDNLSSEPFYGQSLPLLKAVNKNREKIVRSSRERYSKV